MPHGSPLWWLLIGIVFGLLLGAGRSTSAQGPARLFGTAIDGSAVPIQVSGSTLAVYGK